MPYVGHVLTCRWYANAIYLVSLSVGFTIHVHRLLEKGFQPEQKFSEVRCGTNLVIIHSTLSSHHVRFYKEMLSLVSYNRISNVICIFFGEYGPSVVSATLVSVFMLILVCAVVALLKVCFILRWPISCSLVRVHISFHSLVHAE